MYTQCPSCATIFIVSSEQLQLAEGQARCGLCNEVFSAVDSLVHELPQPRPPGQRPEPAPAGTDQASVPEPPKPARERPARAAVDWVERVLGLEGDTEHPGRSRGLRPLGYAALSVLLLILALAQYAHFNSASLAADVGLRPTVETLCALTGCPVPPRRAPGRITIADRTVRSHPAVQGALLVEATLVNRADFAQALPQMQLKLRALNGQVTGMRWFTPEEYLAPGQPGLTDGEAIVPPGGEIELRLEVMEPSGETQGFEFAFR